MLSRRLSRLALLTVLGALAIVSPASAAQLFASPNGAGSACSDAGPCSLTGALVAAKWGDEVILGTGVYQSAGESVKSGITVRGRAGLPRPRLEFNGGGWCGLILNDEATLRYVELRQTASCGVLQARYALIEQVIASAPLDTVAIRDSVIRNSIVTANAQGGDAIVMQTTGVNSVTLRNVTAIAEGTGGSAVKAKANTPTGRMNVLARNVIARGGPGPTGAGFEAGTDDSGAIAKITVDYSNWNAQSTNGLNASIVPGSGNQSVTPAFAPFGGYRQAAGSATVDAGLDEFINGAYDVDGDPRQIDGIDIGADELNPAGTATTGAATAVTDRSATLSGTVNPIGQPTRYYFEYGPTTAYGSATYYVDAGNGGVVAATAALTGLSPATTYHYRLRTTNSLEDAKGADRTFSTLPAPVVQQPPVTAPEPPAEPFAGVELISRRLVYGRRAVTVRLRCRAGAVAQCSGRTRLVARRRHVTLGRARFSIAAGGRARVKVRVTRAGRRLLRRGVRLRARAVSAARDAGGRSKTTRTAVTIRRARQGPISGVTSAQ